MESCEKCWRDYKETIHTNKGIFHYCGLHTKELKEELQSKNESFY
jgi:hypothetical protein